MNKKAIFSFSDYRLFLKKYAETEKTSDPSWSFAKWDKQLGLKTPFSMAMVLKREQKITASLVKKLILYFKFTEDEQAYFEFLLQSLKISPTKLQKPKKNLPRKTR